MEHFPQLYKNFVITRQYTISEIDHTKKLEKLKFGNIGDHAIRPSRLKDLQFCHSNSDAHEEQSHVQPHPAGSTGPDIILPYKNSKRTGTLF